MTPEQFCYWLQGFVEMNPNAMLTGTQWIIVKDHLKLVMNKQTPARNVPFNPGMVFPQDVLKPVFGDPHVVTC